MKSEEEEEEREEREEERERLATSRLIVPFSPTGKTEARRSRRWRRRLDSEDREASPGDR